MIGTCDDRIAHNAIALRANVVEPRRFEPVSQAGDVAWTTGLFATRAAALWVLLVSGIAGSASLVFAANPDGKVKGKENGQIQQNSDELVLARHEADANLARANFFLAMARLNDNRHDRALEALAKIPEKFRDLEWNFAKQKCTGGYLTLYGHLRSVNSVALSPEGSTIASADEGGEIRIWNARSGEELRVIKAHKSEVSSLAFSPDGNVLASGSSDRTVKLWNTQTGEHRMTYSDHPAFVTSVAFSPDGNMIASGSRLESDAEARKRGGYKVLHKGMVKVWDAETNQTIHTLVGHRNHVHDVAFSPDGKTLASSGMEIILWDLDSGKQQSKLDGHDFHVPSVAFSPDGNRILSAGDRGQTAIIWDRESGRQLHTLRGHTKFLLDAAYSPDGKTVATTSADRTIKIWDSKTGKLIRTLTGHQDWVRGVTYSPTGKVLVSASRDCTLKFWDLGVTDELKSIETHGPVFGFALSQKEGLIVSAGTHAEVGIWDLQTSQKTLSIPAERGRSGSSVALSSDGTKVACCGLEKTIQIWDTTSGEKLLELQSNTDSTVREIVFSPDGRLIAAGGSVVDVWEADSGQPLLTFDKHERFVYGLAFSPDSRLLASGSSDKTAKIWDPTDGEVKLTLADHPYPVVDVAFSRDGAAIATVSLGVVRLWNTDDGEMRQSFAHDHARRVAFAGEKRLVTANDSAGPSTLKLWDVVSGEELITLNGHENRIEGLVCSEDGKMILSGGHDRTIKLWNPIDAIVEYRLKEPAQSWIARAAFDADEEKLYGVNRSGKIIAWDLKSRRLLKQPNELPDFEKLQSRTSDGKWLALPGNGHLRLIDLGYAQSRPHRELLKDKENAFSPRSTARFDGTASDGTGHENAGTAAGGTDDSMKQLTEEQRQELLGWYDGESGERITILPERNTLVAVIFWREKSRRSVGEIRYVGENKFVFWQPTSKTALTIQREDGQVVALQLDKIPVTFKKRGGLAEVVGKYVCEKSRLMEIDYQKGELYCSINWGNNAPRTNGWLRAAPDGTTLLQGYKWQETLSLEFANGWLQTITLGENEWNRASGRPPQDLSIKMKEDAIPRLASTPTESQSSISKAAEIDCTLFTKPYDSDEHGAFKLPSSLKWRVMTEYIGRTEDGVQVTDDRLTLVFEDTENRFWPVIAKMSLESAEALNQEISKVIADKRNRETEDAK
mgnify:CR=1 FL=1